MTSSNSYILRPFHINDLHFVLNSWLKELHQQFPNKYVDYNVFNKNMDPVIQKLLNGSLCIVAVNPEDSNQIYGYVVYEPVFRDTVYHFVYVKAVYRGLGIGKALLIAADSAFGTKDCLVTALPKNSSQQPINLTLKAYRLRYDPFAIVRRVYV